MPLVPGFYMPTDLRVVVFADILGFRAHTEDSPLDPLTPERSGRPLASVCGVARLLYSKRNNRRVVRLRG